MIKFIAGIAVIAFTTFCGYLFGKKHRLRKLFFTQMQEFNERFLGEIAYARRPIAEFVSACAYRGEFQALLADYFLSDDERSPSERILAETEKYDFLTEEEGQTVTDYFLMVGKGDSGSQNAYFSSVKEPIAKLRQKAENDAKRYGDLYVKLGFLCGLLILILIV